MTAEKKRILLFTDWYTPGFKAGGPIQSCVNLVRFLSPSYQFFVVCADRDLGDEQPYTSILTGQWTTGINQEQIYYTAPGNYTAAFVRKLLSELQPDIVYLNSMFSIPFTLLPLRVIWLNKFRPLVVLAPRGMLQAGALQLKATKKKIFLQLFRLFGWHRFIRFQATDQQELADIHRHFPTASAMLAENIPNRLPQATPPLAKNCGILKLVFISRIHPKKNLHFILELLKNWKNKADLLLHIYGDAGDFAYVQECKRIARELPPSIQVEFKGPVDNKLVFPTLLKYHAFILPSLGENFGHAIFEALDAGKPVLISNKTPWIGLESVYAGWDIPLEAKERYWTALDLLVEMDQVTYNKWSAGAQKRSQSYIDQANFQHKYQALFG